MVLLAEVASLEDGTDVITIADANPTVFPTESEVHRASAELEMNGLVTMHHRRRKAGRRGHRSVRSLSITDAGWSALLEGASDVPLSEGYPVVQASSVGSVITDSRERGLFANLGSGRRWVKRYPGKWYLETRFGSSGSVIVHDKIMARLLDREHCWFSTPAPNTLGASAPALDTGDVLCFTVHKPDRLLHRTVIAVKTEDVLRQRQPEKVLGVLGVLGFVESSQEMVLDSHQSHIEDDAALITRYIPNSLIQPRRDK